jgi:hypothetical protein
MVRTMKTFVAVSVAVLMTPRRRRRSTWGGDRTGFWGGGWHGAAPVWRGGGRPGGWGIYRRPWFGSCGWSCGTFWTFGLIGAATTLATAPRGWGAPPVVVRPPPVWLVPSQQPHQVQVVRGQPIQCPPTFNR